MGTMEKLTELRDQLKYVPVNPGVYIYKDKSGSIIYVGKARNLKNRVRSYFQDSKNLTAKTSVLVAEIYRIDYIITDSELEALILEGNLIKHHKPKYNVRLKDDKSYPFIKVTKEEFPCVFLTRNVKEDGAKYYGPYTDVRGAREVLGLLKKIFPIRNCKGPMKVKDHNGRPCLNFHIKRCLAPCSGCISKEDYTEIIQEVCMFLEGRNLKLLSELKGKMKLHAENLEYEKAASIRDQVNAVENIIEKQRIVLTSPEDLDAIGFSTKGEYICVQVFFIREGKLISGEYFFLEDSYGMEPSELVAEFLRQYYGKTSIIPPQILLPIESADEDLLTQWLSSLRGKRTTLHVPQRGEKKDIVDMAEANAALALDREVARFALEKERTVGALEELAKVLKLDNVPSRIEGFDISNIQGTNAVGSMVVFVDGVSFNSAYRRFRIKSIEGPDDYGMLQEVLRRRYSGVKGKGEEPREFSREDIRKEQGHSWPLPDLILVDGGRGQLNSALEVLKEAGLSYIPCIGLAEEYEEIYVKDKRNPIRLPADSKARQLLQRIRDEAHRFALSYHRNLREREALVSSIDSIPGIGPSLRKALINHIGPIEEIKKAEIKQLMKVPGIGYEKARAIKEFLGDIRG